MAEWADNPVSELDLHARHKWLLEQPNLRDHLKSDPEYHDPKIAGWWVWGINCWIGQGWCRKEANQIPHLGTAGQGINRRAFASLESKKYWLQQLSNRFSGVRVTSGSWERILGPSVTFKHGITGVFLDPPYASDEHSIKYAANTDISSDVRNWAIENGDNPELRVAICGYEGEHQLPDTWEVVEWAAQGGYGSQSNKQGRDNAKRERIWFSPHCLKPSSQLGLF